jgi:hypothetical protein
MKIGDKRERTFFRALLLSYALTRFQDGRNCTGDLVVYSDVVLSAFAETKGEPPALAGGLTRVVPSGHSGHNARPTTR